jgi:hypothetical protein
LLLDGHIDNLWPGLNPTISKNRKILFSLYRGKFQTDKFLLLNRKYSAQIFWCC